MIDNRIHSIALIGARNTPLYVRNFASAAAGNGAKSSDAAAATSATAGQLKTNFIAHSALDIIEERTVVKQQEQYLGLLFTMEDVAVYVRFEPHL